MSTGNLKLDMLLERIKRENGQEPSDALMKEIKKQFPSAGDQETAKIHALVCEALSRKPEENAKLVLTAPTSFSVRALSTKNTVLKMVTDASSSITITGYSLSEYFDDVVDMIIQKSREGVFVKFFVNDIDKQNNFDKLLRYKGRFLELYNYRNKEDQMSALHAKVISVDRKLTLITSANLSYHGQLGNIEMGSLIDSSDFAKQVEDVFTQLIFSKVFVKIQE